MILNDEAILSEMASTIIEAALISESLFLSKAASKESFYDAASMYDSINIAASNWQSQ